MIGGSSPLCGYVPEFRIIKHTSIQRVVKF